MTAERLDQIEARANAATEGPWDAINLRTNYFLRDEWIVGAAIDELPIVADLRDAGTQGGNDAAFIAHARTDVPWLIEQVRRRDAALRAVLDLHRPVCVYAYAEDCGCGNEDHVIIEDEWGEDLCFDTPTGDVRCAYCRAEQSYVEHPCPTVTAIEEALG